MNSKLTVSRFCDLEEAFDCVNHDILLLKLEFYRIVGRAYTLMKSIFKNTDG